MKPITYCKECQNTIFPFLFSQDCNNKNCGFKKNIKVLKS